MSSQFEFVKHQEHCLDLFYSTRLTHAHWSTASCFLLDVCSDRSGQIVWTNAQLRQQSRAVNQHFITAQSLNVMGVTAKNIKMRRCASGHFACKGSEWIDQEVVLTWLESHTWWEPPLCRPQSRTGLTAARDTAVLLYQKTSRSSRPPACERQPNY